MKSLVPAIFATFLLAPPALAVTSSPPTPPGGASGQIQYNNGGQFGGSSFGSFDGATWTLAAALLGGNGFIFPSSGLAGIWNGGTIGWSSTSIAAGAQDTSLGRDAIGIIGQRSGTNPQTYRIYSSFTDLSNYGRIAMSCTSATACFIGAQAAGTGVLPSLTFVGSIRRTGGVVTAAGTSLATATPLPNDVDIITGGTGGVSLPAYNSTLGGIQRVSVSNISGAAQNIYPPSASATIWNLNGSTSAGAAGAPVTLANGTHGTFECYSATQCLEAP